jgi:hypothetical protein
MLSVMFLELFKPAGSHQRINQSSFAAPIDAIRIGTGLTVRVRVRVHSYKWGKSVHALYLNLSR